MGRADGGRRCAVRRGRPLSIRKLGDVSDPERIRHKIGQSDLAAMARGSAQKCE
jgi:hypothetical protein